MSDKIKNTINGDFDKIIEDINNIWRDKVKDDCPFWTSLANSYLSEKSETLKNNKFHSTISFYPKLINYLADNNFGNNIKILFLSTLLPRHYWNFPAISYLTIDNNKDDLSVIKVANGKDNSSTNIINEYLLHEEDYLNKYRDTISEIHENITIERVLIVAKKRVLFKNTQLFSVQDLRVDNKYCIPCKKIGWSEVIDNKINFTTSHNFSSGCSNQSRSKYFSPNIEDSKSATSIDIRRKLEDKKYFLFNSNNSKYRSLLDFYLHDLHSKDSAKILILGDTTLKNNSTKQRLLNETYNVHEFSVVNNEINLDLGRVEIGSELFILNVYMDLINDLIKLEVIDKRHSKFESLNAEIDKIYNLAEELILKPKNNTCSNTNIATQNSFNFRKSKRNDNES